MGNVPNRWGARGIAIGVGLLLAAAAWLVGSALANAWARGFTFDWFVHDATRPTVADASIAVGASAALAALFAILLVAAPAVAVVRWRIRENRYLAPPVARPMTTDVHAGRFTLVVVPLLAALAALGTLVDLAILGATRVGPADFTLFVAAACAFAAGIAAAGIAWLTFSGLVRGTLVFDPSRNLLGRMAEGLARHRKTALGLLVAACVLAGFFALQVDTQARGLDALPRADPRLSAATNLSQKLDGGFTQQVTLHFRVIDASSQTQAALFQHDSQQRLPNRVTDAHPENITDEVYVRAVDEATRFLLGSGAFTLAIGEPDAAKLVNWTFAGGDSGNNAVGNASFALPDTTQAGELRYRALQEGVLREQPVYRALDDLASPGWTQTVLLLHANGSLTPREAGEAAIAARDAYVKEVQSNPSYYKVFGAQNPPLFSVDEPLAQAHQGALQQRDINLLLPIAGIFLVAVIVVALRHPIPIVVALSTSAIAAIWSVGLLGAFRVPLAPLALSGLALALGCGVAFTLHVVTEHEAARRAGRSRAEAWHLAGRGSLPAILAAVGCALAALVFVMISPSLAVAQLGLVVAVGLAASALAALVVPAPILSLGESDPARPFAPSRIMRGFGDGIRRARWGAIAALAVILVASAFVASAPASAGFADVPRSWSATDALRLENEKALEGFYETNAKDAKAHALLFEGDLADPAAHTYIRAVTRALGAAAANQSSLVINGSLRDLPSVVEAYVATHRGVNGTLLDTAYADLPGALAASDPSGQTQKYPATRDEMRGVLDGLARSPLGATSRLLLSPAYDAAITIVPLRAGDPEAAQREVAAILATQNATRPANMTVQLVGVAPAESATASVSAKTYGGMPWTDAALLAGVVAATLLIGVATRDWRALLAAALGLGAAAFALRALLGFIGLARSPGLAPAIVALIALGALACCHLALRGRAGFDISGKAALHGFVAALGVALILTQAAEASARLAMGAGALAIGCGFLMAAVAVPALAARP